MPPAVTSTPTSPALCAAEPGVTRNTNTPLLPVSACRRVLSCSSTSMPSAGRMYLPVFMSCGTTRMTVSTGTAKPMPAEAPDGL